MGFMIAVDGPAASGKGTIATRLGALYGFPVLDSGLLYRAVGVRVLEAGGDLGDAAAAEAAARSLDPAELERPEVRTRQAGEAASRVAIYTPVREALREFQRAFARQEPGAVIDGRDIGTVIAPEAPAKLYVTASAQVRAQRRWRQLTGQGEAVAFDDILADIHRRDERDSSRADSPMAPAPDAVLLDTTEMTIEAAADAARRIVEAARAKWLSGHG
ncbi:MAG TPA: (d)CMP kinase [Caulobacteraceae bacterium]|jgi:cytidylate kinase|nr:(d)CMP kinase [Caulobacteraceae bacterium]